MGLISDALSYSGKGESWFDISVNVNLSDWPSLDCPGTIKIIFENYFTTWKTIALSSYEIYLGWFNFSQINPLIFQNLRLNIGSITSPRAIKRKYPKQGAYSDVTFFLDSDSKGFVGTAIIIKDIQNNKFLGIKILSYSFYGGEQVVTNTKNVDGKIDYNQYLYTPYTFVYNGNVSWQYSNLFFKPYSKFDSNGAIISKQGTTMLGANFVSSTKIPYSASSTVTYDSETGEYTENVVAESGELEINLSYGDSFQVVDLLSRFCYNSYEEYLLGVVDLHKKFTQYSNSNYDEENTDYYYKPELDQNIALLTGTSGLTTVTPPYTGFFT